VATLLKEPPERWVELMRLGDNAHNYYAYRNRWQFSRKISFPLATR